MFKNYIYNEILRVFFQILCYYYELIRFILGRKKIVKIKKIVPAERAEGADG